MANTVKAVIFDLYGVLAINGWQGFKAHHFTDREHIWDQVFELGRRVDAGLADYEELITFTSKQSGESEQTVRYQLEHTVANQELLDYIRTELKPHYKLAILSNASDHNVISQVFTEDQEALFDVVLLSRSIGLTKPDAAAYQAVADKLQLDATDCVFVDDQDRHARGARETGMQALLYSDTTKLKQDLAKIL